MRISDWSSDVCSSDLPSQVRGFVTGRKSPPPTRSFLMSDLDSIATPSIDWAIVTAQSAAREALATALLPVNKTALFDVLAAAAVTTVVVSFDGYGDSGQIESVEARAGDDFVDLPAITVTQGAALWEGSRREASTPLLPAPTPSLTTH